MCMVVLLACMSVHEVSAQYLLDPWDWSYRWLRVVIWMLGIEPQLSGSKSSGSALNHGAISLAPFNTKVKVDYDERKQLLE